MSAEGTRVSKVANSVMKQTKPEQKHRILCLEDDPGDQALLEVTLSRSGMQCEYIHVTGQAAYEAALKNCMVDLIISDYSLPSYSGMAALETARKLQPDTPFLFYSGTIGEDRAVESLKQGATDYVIKHRPDRLPAAVERALREARDRRERRQLEAQLRQAQKMEAIGQLAGGVAHDFNNLLGVIYGNAELLLTRADAFDPALREGLLQITSASERAANLTRQLLAFSRKQAVQLKPVDLNQIIADLARMLDRLIGKTITLTRNFQAPLAYIHADTGMMEQVLLNLVLNARDAMPQGGELYLTTRKIQIDETYARSHAHLSTGEFICMTVADTGIGIAPEHLPNIFEPFFTTKPAGQGTGLGLATVYGIVKQHEGWIDVSSRLGAGTTFSIYLPALEPPAHADAPAPAKKYVRAGRERILLVEHNLTLRLLTRRMLEASGYSVVEAATAVEAREAWQQRESPIQVLLTNLVLSDGTDGRDLAEQLRKEDSRLKVIFATGCGTEILGRNESPLRRADALLLQKPYPSHMLIAAVRQSIDGPTGAAVNRG